MGGIEINTENEEEKNPASKNLSQRWIWQIVFIRSAYNEQLYFNNLNKKETEKVYAAETKIFSYE